MGGCWCGSKALTTALEKWLWGRIPCQCTMDRWRMSITKKPASSAASTDAIDRPFAASVLAEARRLADEYQVTIWFDKDEGGWCGRCVELPLCMGFGTNPTKCLKSAREIIETTVAVMIEDGEAVPLPETAAAQRTEQINVRLTKSEKRLFEE